MARKPIPDTRKSHTEIWDMLEKLTDKHQKMEALDAIYSEKGTELYFKEKSLLWVLGRITDEELLKIEDEG